MELVTLADTVPSPSATSVGNRISDPPPAMELIAPARNETPAAMRRSTADTTCEPTVGGTSMPGRARALLLSPARPERASAAAGGRRFRIGEPRAVHPAARLLHPAQH